MGRSANPQVQAVWQARLARQAASGLSVAEFCSREGVSTASYYGWRNRLRGSRKPKTSMAGRASRGAMAGVADRESDAEVRFIQIPLSGLRGAATVELTLPDGTIVRVPTENGAALELVLSMLLNRQATAKPKEVAHD